MAPVDMELMMENILAIKRLLLEDVLPRLASLEPIPPQLEALEEGMGALKEWAWCGGCRVTSEEEEEGADDNPGDLPSEAFTSGNAPVEGGDSAPLGNTKLESNQPKVEEVTVEDEGPQGYEDTAAGSSSNPNGQETDGQDRKKRGSTPAYKDSEDSDQSYLPDHSDSGEEYIPPYRSGDEASTLRKMKRKKRKGKGPAINDMVCGTGVSDDGGRAKDAPSSCEPAGCPNERVTRKATGKDELEKSERNSQSTSSLHEKDKGPSPDLDTKKNQGQKRSQKYQCQLCSYQTQKKSNFTCHQLIHTCEKPYGCNACDKKFSRKGDLKRHNDNIHIGLKRYSCDWCSRKFSLKETLEDHKRTHTGERPFSCKVCKKSFATRSNWLQHMKTHDVQRKLHSCSHCNKAFTRKHNLISHVKAHTSEKPYCCDVCQKRFRDGSVLSRHKRTHTGEKPYSCTACNRKFSRKSDRDHHLRSHKSV